MISYGPVRPKEGGRVEFALTCWSTTPQKPAHPEARWSGVPSQREGEGPGGGQDDKHFAAE